MIYVPVEFWMVLALGSVLLWRGLEILAWLLRPRCKPVPPLVIPAELCATPWQLWLQRQAEIAELRVEYAAAPYPPKGPGGASGPGWNAPPPRPSYPSPTEGVRYRSGDGRTDVWLPGPPRLGLPTKGELR